MIFAMSEGSERVRTEWFTRYDEIFSLQLINLQMLAAVINEWIKHQFCEGHSSLRFSYCCQKVS
jgi:hypothetical protein